MSKIMESMESEESKKISRPTKNEENIRISALERKLKWKDQEIKRLNEFIEKGRKELKARFDSMVSLSAEVVALDDECQRLENEVLKIASEARADERAKLLPRWYVDPIWFFGMLAVMILMLIYIVSGFFKKKKRKT